MAKLMGWESRAAMLSYSTKGSGDTDNVLKVVDAVKIANRKRPDLLIDGEFQVDAALIPEVAAKKVKTKSKVAGRANIIVFPDLNAGNIGVKLINIFGGYPDYGALLAGLRRPCVDLSRSSSLDLIVGACIMLVVTAQQ
jgi:phosphate acetyltransferase